MSAGSGFAGFVGSIGLIGAIAGRDLRSLFFSPLAWTLLAFMQLVIGIIFVVQLQIFLDPPRAAALSGAWGLTRVVVAPIFNWAAFLLMLTAPVLTMRAISDERRLRTASLLLSSPLTALEIVLGKYAALLGFYCVQLALLAVLPTALLAGGSLDYWLFGAELLGLALLAASFASFGLFVSTTTEQPAVAALGTFTGLLILWVLSWRAPGDVGGVIADALHYLSWQNHLEPLLRGVVDTTDVAYFLLFAATGLALSVRGVAALRDPT